MKYRVIEVVNVVRLAGCLLKRGDGYYSCWNKVGGPGHAEVRLIYGELREDMDAGWKKEVVDAVRHAVRLVRSLSKLGDVFYFWWETLLHLVRKYAGAPSGMTRCVIHPRGCMTNRTQNWKH